MKKLSILAAAATLLATPAFAAGDEFWSLSNTDLIVSMGFVLFVGIILYFKVPATIAGLLDKRSNEIRSDLEEARRLREEAQELRAAFEKKRAEVSEQAERIVAKAKADAAAAADQAKAELEVTIARRLKAAEEQIAAAETAALREVRNSAVAVSVAAASDVLARSLNGAQGNALIDESIEAVAARLH